MGPDELSAKLLTEVQNEIAYPLLLLFKKSLSESSISQEWKQANVTPIFKKGSIETSLKTIDQLVLQAK